MQAAFRITFSELNLSLDFGNELDLFLEFLDSVSICLKLTESFPFMWWYYELYRLEMQERKVSADFKRNVEIGPFGSIWK